MSESNGSSSNGNANGKSNGSVATAVPETTRKDWTSDQEVRWCPGCGDYSILATVQMLMPELGHAAARTRCSSRVSGDRGAVPVLHEHVRHALHPRPRPGHRDQLGHHAARPRRVGDLGRRWHAIHRRENA